MLLVSTCARKGSLQLMVERFFVGIGLLLNGCNKEQPQKSRDKTELEFVTPVTPGGSVKILPAV